MRENSPIWSVCWQAVHKDADIVRRATSDFYYNERVAMRLRLCVECRFSWLSRECALILEPDRSEGEVVAAGAKETGGIVKTCEFVVATTRTRHGINCRVSPVMMWLMRSACSVRVFKNSYLDKSRQRRPKANDGKELEIHPTSDVVCGIVVGNSPISSSTSIIKHQTPNLDTLPSRRILGRVRVHERRVRCPDRNPWLAALHALPKRVKALQ